MTNLFPGVHFVGASHPVHFRKLPALLGNNHFRVLVIGVRDRSEIFRFMSPCTSPKDFY